MIDNIIEKLYIDKDIKVYEIDRIKLSNQSIMYKIGLVDNTNKYISNQLEIEFPIENYKK